MARKRQEAATTGGKMTLDQRLASYRSSGRKELTPRQLRRLAHKAGISTTEVLERASKA